LGFLTACLDLEVLFSINVGSEGTASLTTFWVDTAGVIELQAMTSKASNPKGKIRFIELTELVLET
jgi:hypothetical protein